MSKMKFDFDFNIMNCLKVVKFRIEQLNDNKTYESYLDAIESFY